MSENTNTERDRAIMEGERNASLDSYSRVVYLTQAESRIYETAFTNGWNRRESLSLPAAGQEPVAHLWQHCETGRTRIVMPDMIVDADASWQVVGPLYLGAAPPTAQAEGWRLVPVEPTPEMVDAAQEAYMPFGDMQLAIQLAIAAAPQPVAREPLSAEQYNILVEDLSECSRHVEVDTAPRSLEEHIHQVFAIHGIKGGQHGTE